MKIRYFIFFILTLVYGVPEISAQCTALRTPTNVQLQIGPSAGTIGSALTPTSEQYDVTVGFDIGCTEGRVCDNSIYWYVGFYSQTSPAPNGLNVEYGTGSFFGVGCDFTQIVDGGEYAIGNTTGADCMYPKASTCFSQELAQDEGTNATFGIGAGEDACLLGSIIAGTEVSFTLPAALCSGITYDVFVWEISVDQTNYTSTSSLNEDIACGTIGAIGESTPSAVATITAPGQINQIDVPTLTIDYTAGDQVCASGAPMITSDYTTTPMVTNAPDCAAVTDNVLTNTLMADTDIQLVAAGTGNSGNGALQLGPNVFELNCRDVFELSYSTPTGCGGTFAHAGSTTTSNAYTYVMANATPYASRGDFSMWDPALQDPLQPNPFNIPQCIDAPTSIQCPSNLDGGTQSFPNNYTLAFGPFVDQDGVEQTTGNGGGNPFPVEGSNPFNAPNTEIIDFGDGIARSVSTVCVRYEDGCNGTKSMTCATFISDASPMEATADQVQMSCAAADNGQLVITGLVGGSPDPNGDGDLADGAGTYNFVGTPAPFTQCSPGVWETDAVVAPGVYTVTVQDPLAAGCGSACDVELEFVIRNKLPSTITGTATVCPDQCVTVEAILQENPIVEYEVEQTFDGTSLNTADCPFTEFDITGDFVNMMSSVAPAGGTCSSIVGNGALDASLVELCFEIDPGAHPWSDLFISLDNATATAGFGQENLFVGTTWTSGGLNGPESGNGIISFCTSSPIGSTYDGTLDGVSSNFPGVGAGFDGSVFSSFKLFVGQTGGSGCDDDITLISSSFTIIDRCVEPQTATICNMAGMDALNWVFDSGASDLLTLNGPDNTTGEFCAPAGTPGGDNVYNVSGFHTSSAMIDDAACGVPTAQCCPITGQVTVTVLDVPAPPTPSLTNGQEFCSGDAAVPLTFSPPLGLTPGGLVIANYNGGGFPGELFLGLYTETTLGSGAFDNFIFGTDVIANGNFCNNADGGPGLDAFALSDALVPGDYNVCFAEGWGDGLNGATFDIQDHCGTSLLTSDDYNANPCVEFCQTFTVQPNMLTVTGPGVTLTSDPDAIPNNGDEIYEFDPAAANVAAADGADCGINTINYMITTSCGCMVDENIALFVYDEPTATDPASKVEADCNADGTLTFSLAELQAALSGGTGNYLMTYDDGEGNSATNAALADITIDALNATSPLVVTITDDDTAYSGMVVDPTDPTGTAMLACNGNACSTTLNLAFEPCLIECSTTITADATPMVCDGQLAAEVADWQTAVETDNTGETVVYSSVLPVAGATAPDNMIPTGVHSDPMSCDSEDQIVSAYVYCDTNGNNTIDADDTYTLVSTLTLTVFPAAKAPEIMQIEACTDGTDGQCTYQVTFVCAGDVETTTVDGSTQADGFSGNLTIDVQTANGCTASFEVAAPSCACAADPSFTCPPADLDACSGQVTALNPVEMGGVWSGTGASFVNANNEFDPAGAPVDVPLTLFYTVQDGFGVSTTSTPACVITVVRNCAANGGSFGN